MDEWMQLSAFPELVPDTPLKAVPAVEPQERAVNDGTFHLLSNRLGRVGWHRVKALGKEGAIMARCGYMGHALTDFNEGPFTPCHQCLITPEP